MSTTSYPRVAVGDGKFCYSGPNCKRHGKATGLLLVEQQNKDFIASFSFSLEECKNAYSEAIENSRWVQNLSELGNESLLKGYLARKCSDHDGYHIYLSNDALIRTGTRKLFLDLTDRADKGLLTFEEVNSLRAKLVEYSRDVLDSYRIADKRTMNWLQRQHANGGANQEAKNARNKQLIAARLQQEITDTEKLPTSTTSVMCDVNTVSKELLLEYYQCGRKQSFISMKEAEKMIAFQNDDSLSTYSCRHCAKNHVGHGDGLTPQHKQLLSAKKHWKDFPEKSNMFAFAKGLI